MRELDDINITEAVIETFADSPDPRLKRVMTSLVRHLHDFARDVSLTPDEWLGAIKFLTAVGQTCTPQRQELILLSDTLGFSALVNAMSSRGSDGTRSSLLGPFFRENAPERQLGDNICIDTPGETVVVSGHVRDGAGRGLGGAWIDVWQPSSEGLYDIQGAHPEEMNYRARFRTAADGSYHFRTVLPIGYSIPTDGPVGDLMRALGRHGCRPAHIHFLLGAEGCRELATALYIAGDQYIETDAVFGVSSSLIVPVQPADPKSSHPELRRISYDFVLPSATDSSGSHRVGADPSKVGRAAE